MRPMPLNSVEDVVARSAQRRQVFRHKQHSERQHPHPKQRQDAEKTAADQHGAGDDPHPARRGSPQPAGRRLHATREEVDQYLDSFLVASAGRRGRRQYRIGYVGRGVHPRTRRERFAPILGVSWFGIVCSSLSHRGAPREPAGSVGEAIGSSPADIDRSRHAEHGDPTSRGCPIPVGGPRQRGPDQ